MTKKLTRSKRKELRQKGQLKVPPRLSDAQRAAERQAEEEAQSARIHEAHQEIADREDGAAPVAAAKKKSRRDLSLLLMFGLIGLAGLVYWLSQRPPSEPSRAASSASARAPVMLTAPVPRPSP